MPLPRQPLAIFKVIVVAAAALELLAGVDDELLLGVRELTADELDGATLVTDELEELAGTILELLEVMAVLELLAGFDPPPPLPPQAMRPRDKKVKHKSG